MDTNRTRATVMKTLPMNIVRTVHICQCPDSVKNKEEKKKKKHEERDSKLNKRNSYMSKYLHINTLMHARMHERFTVGHFYNSPSTSANQKCMLMELFEPKYIPRLSQIHRLHSCENEYTTGSQRVYFFFRAKSASKRNG